MTKYIEIPIETDPEILAQEGFDFLQGTIPGWAPNDANLETIMIEAVARMTAEARDVASAVPQDIFRFFGELVDVTPQDATFATGSTDWTMINNAGYTIPAGTQIGVRTAGDVLVPFITDAESIVDPGSSTALNVLVHAAEAGSDASGLTGSMELIDTLDFVTGITLDSPGTTGGQDAETEEEYLDRLASRLQLLGPRPILPVDFAVLAQDVNGVERALPLDGYNPDATAFTGTTSSGSPTISVVSSFTGITVGSIISGAGIPTNSKVLSVNPGASTMVIDHNATASAGGVSLTSTGTYNNERYVTVALADSEGEAVGSTIKTDADAYLQARREVNFVVRVIDPTYTTVDVTFTAVAKPGFVLADVESATEAAVTAYLDPSNWGLPQESTDDILSARWFDEPVVRYLELAQVINEVGGVNYVTSLTLRKGSDAFASTDVPLNGVATMPRAGVITGTVT